MFVYFRQIVCLLLLPFRLIALVYATTGIAALFTVGLGRAYIATIIRNIASNFFFPTRFDLDAFRKKHTHILGSTGSGKSSTIEFFIDQNIRKGQGFLLIEPHGEIGQRVLHNKHFALTHRSQAYKNLVYLDFDGSPPALNIFKLPLPSNDKLKTAFIDGLSTELADAFCMNMKPASTEAQFIMLRNIIMAGFYIENACFMDLLKMLTTDKDTNQKYLQSFAKIPSPPLRQYFQSDFQSSSTKRTKEALRSRLTSLVIPQPLYRSLCASDCSIDFESILAANKFVIVKASAPLLGSYEAQTIGNLMVNLFNKYAFERLITGKRCSSYFVYLDEAQYYINPAIQRALTGVRKTGLNYTLAHQELNQEEMTPSQQKTIVHNTHVKIYGGLQWKDLKEATNILRLSDTDALENLKPGQFMIKAGNIAATQRHFPSKFSIPQQVFGRSWLCNAYMQQKEFQALKSFIHNNTTDQQRDESPKEFDFLEPVYAHPDQIKNAEQLNHLSFKSFRLYGSKSTKSQKE